MDVIQMAIVTPMSSLARVGKNACRGGGAVGGGCSICTLSFPTVREEKGAKIRGGILLSSKRTRSGFCNAFVKE